MAASMNMVILVGNLGKDPEVRNTQTGGKIANLTIATSESWTDRQSGERKEKTEWHRVAIFHEKLADVAERFLHKGSKVMVEGKLTTRKWTDQGGQERYTTEIVLGPFNSTLLLLDGARREDGDSEPRADPPASGGMSDRAARSGGTAPRQASVSPGHFGGPGSDLDDEIPF